MKSSSISSITAKGKDASAIAEVGITCIIRDIAQNGLTIEVEE